MAASASAGSAGTEVPVVWRGHRVHAFVPTLLADRDLTLSAATVARTSAAAATVQASAEGMPTDNEPLARLLLRAEGVASSFLEGITAPAIDVVLAEASPTADHSPSAWVAANLTAVRDAIAAAPATPCSVDLLCSWHRTLMSGSPTPERYVGVLRDEQGWIGGTSPLDAALVTPPHELLPELLADLVAFANRRDVDPVAQVAVAHAQFEVIHPFADGNGRVGRLLVGWLLTRRLQLLTPPPVSGRLAADRGGYLAGLTLFRLGELQPWVRWFADAVTAACRGQRALVAEVAALRQQWQAALGAPRAGRALRRDALAWRVLDLLPRHLVLTAGLVARSSGCTERAARDALHELSRAGILVRHDAAAAQPAGRPAHLYVSPQLLGLVGSSPLR